MEYSSMSNRLVNAIRKLSQQFTQSVSSHHPTGGHERGSSQKEVGMQGNNRVEDANVEIDQLGREDDNRVLKLITTAFFVFILVGTAIFYVIAVISPILELPYSYNISPGTEKFVSVSFAVAIALLVVLSLSYVAGPIEFEALGFKFRGASGPVVLWVMCFLALVIGLYVLD
jgi:hypothetical protein